LITNAYPKYVVQGVAGWSYGPGWSPNEMEGYFWLKDRNVTDIVMPLCSGEEKPISLGLKSIPYDKEVYDMRKQIFNLSDNNFDIVGFLKRKNIKYIVLDTQCVTIGGLNATNTLINQMVQIAEPIKWNGEVAILRLR